MQSPGLPSVLLNTRLQSICSSFPAPAPAPSRPTAWTLEADSRLVHHGPHHHTINQMQTQGFSAGQAHNESRGPSRREQSQEAVRGSFSVNPPLKSTRSSRSAFACGQNCKPKDRHKRSAAREKRAQTTQGNESPPRGHGIVC